MRRKKRNKIMQWLLAGLMITGAQLAAPGSARAQAPGTTPVVVSHETQTMHGRKYYVHIVEKGQTVYSISRAYKVESYDAVTHVDIHFLHPGDTVWLPCRGQFAETESTQSTVKSEERRSEGAKTTQRRANEPASTTVKPEAPAQPVAAPKVRKTGKTLRVALMMPLHLNQIEEISTSKFDVEQRGKKSYRQFEFIEFYEGVLLALDKLEADGIAVNLNVVDVTDNTDAAVEAAFVSHKVAESDMIVALLLRDAFAKAAELAQQAGVYIVNPMATRSEIVEENPFVVKTQPSTATMISQMLDNMHMERPNAHLYIVFSNAKAERPVLDELKRQLGERKDIKYTLFNWSQSARLANTLKATPSCNVLSIYEQGRDNDRVFVSNLLNRLSAFKTNTPTLYSLNDWTKEYPDVDFAQLQLLNYHTYYTSWDMTNEVHVDFLRSFRNRFGTEPTSALASTGYDLMVYLCTGLHQRNTVQWETPIRTLPALTQPMHLSRQQAGLENDNATLYRMQDLRFVPAVTQ